MRLRTLTLVILATATVLATVSAQSVNTASDLYFEALRHQESKGDLTKAISTYKSLVDRYNGLYRSGLENLKRLVEGRQ